MSWYFYFYLKNLLRSLLFEAENRFTYWDTGGKRDLDLGLAPGECLVSKTGVTCFFQTVRLKQVSCLTRGIKSHNQAQDYAATEAVG